MTLAAKLREFFTRNADEELTTDDIRVKFSVAESTAQTAIAKLRRERFLDARKEGQTVFYFARFQ